MNLIAQIIAQVPVGMEQLYARLGRRRSTATARWAVAALSFAMPFAAAGEDDPQHGANDPLTPKMAFQMH